MHIYSSVNTANQNFKSASTEPHAQERACALTSGALNVAILGARGYSGMELFRILLQHPGVAQITLGLNEKQFALSDLLPEVISKPVHIKSVSQLIEEASQFQLFFMATPAEVSMELAPQLLKAKTNVIDLSGAFRLSSPALYQKWYNFEHQAADLLNQAHFGLSPLSVIPTVKRTPTIATPPLASTELPVATSSTAGTVTTVATGSADRTDSSDPKQVNQNQLIANPGCFATSVLMALAPLLKEKLISPQQIVIDSKSGTTGAGKKAAENLLFSEVDGECLPYRISKHQHLPEICEHILKFTGQAIEPMFSTSLIPVRRGIISGIYAQLNSGVNVDDITRAYNKYYGDYPLVKFSQTEKAPQLLSLKRVVGSAKTHISYTVDQCSTGQRLYLYSSIDNLMKGAASQAIENMNHLWGWPVETGLLYREGVL